MITTRTINAETKSTKQNRCPHCGHIGAVDEFAFELPGAQMCFDGASRFFQVQFPGEDKPRRFDREPSRAEIAAMFKALDEKQPEKEDKPKRSRKAKMLDNAALEGNEGGDLV